MKFLYTIIIAIVLNSTASAVRCHLTEIECVQVVQMVDDGFSQIKGANVFGVSQSVVSRVVQRHQETGTYCRRPGGGPPRSTDVSDDRHLRLLVNHDPFQSTRRLQLGFQDAAGIRLST